MIRTSAHIQKKTRMLTVSITLAGPDPRNQYWDETEKEFVPDRTLVPLTLVPEVQLDDGTSYAAPTDFVSCGWYAVRNGKETQIEATTPGHTLFPADFPLGLQVRTNTPADTAVQYVFRCRTRESVGIGVMSLRTTVSAGAKPSLSIDAPTAQFWNPFIADMDKVTVHPSVRSRGKVCTVRWRKIVSGKPVDIDPSTIRDLELTLDAATNALTIDRRLMGADIALVCQLLVDGKVVDEKPISMKRQIPAYTVDINATRGYSESDTSVYAEAIVKYCSGGIIANPSSELRIPWYDGNAKVGEGNSHTFSTVGRDSLSIGIDEASLDRGPVCVIIDPADGYAVIDPKDGAILVGR